jgi:WD40 repeat protein
MTTSARYGAFISYSHAASAEVARGLQKWLQIYAKPWWRWRAVNVFRDETDLTAAPALWSRIANALDQSSHFILLASPNAAQSMWIKREIRYWLGDKRAGALDGPALDAPIANPKPERIATLLIALTAGDLSWDDEAGSEGDFDWGRTSALPHLLSGAFSEEPQWVDLRTIIQQERLRTSLSRSNSEFMRAVAQLAAPIRGITDFSRLVSEDYRQYRRTIWTAWAVVAVLAVVTVAAVWQWRTAVAQRDRAVLAEGAAKKANAQAQVNAQQAKANADKAEANLREAQIGQSRFLADQADQRREAGDAGSAVLLALEALPDASPGKDRPYVSEAEFQLDKAWRDLRERLILSQDEVLDAAFSPDGKRIEIASLSGTVRIWDAESGSRTDEQLKAYNAQRDAFEVLIKQTAFSPDGKRIVTVLKEGDITRILDAESGKTIGDLIGHGGPVFSVAFSPDGKCIVTASKDATARVWDAATGKPIGQPFRGHTSALTSAAFSPDGKRIVTASYDQTARIWDAATGKPIGQPLRGHQSVVRSAAFSPDGKRIVTASEDKTARIWDAATGTLIGEPLRGHEHWVSSAAFSPDGKRIVTASRDNTARVWDAPIGEPVSLPLKGPIRVAASAAFSLDGKRIVITSLDGKVGVWDAESGKAIGEFFAAHGKVWNAAFSADGKRFVTASDDGTAAIWDAESLRPIGEPIRCNEANRMDNVKSAALGPNGERMVAICGDGTARVWDVEARKPIGDRLKVQHDEFIAAAFSPDGKLIVMASSDKTARLWDAESGKPVGQPPTEGQRDWVVCAAFSPDLKRIVTVSQEGKFLEKKTARVWDAESGKPIGDPSARPSSCPPSHRTGASRWRNGLTTLLFGNGGLPTSASGGIIHEPHSGRGCSGQSNGQRRCSLLHFR